MSTILPVPPAFPVPVLPQVFDTSLSYYELLAKLTEQINAAIIQINTNTGDISALKSTVSEIAETSAQMQIAIAELQEQIAGVPQAVADLTAALATETAERIEGDGNLAAQIAAVSNRLQTFYPTFDDLETLYLLGGLTFQLLTQSEFDEIERAGQLVPKRIYFIDTGANIVIRYHYATGSTPTMNAQASGIYNFRFNGMAPHIRGTFTPDE